MMWHFLGSVNFSPRGTCGSLHSGGTPSQCRTSGGAVADSKPARLLNVDPAFASIFAGTPRVFI